MTRRETLAWLASLPAVGSIRRADVRPASVIVVECPGAISQAMIARITHTLRQVWAEPQRIVVLTEGMRLSVLDERAGEG